jgi:hypothetical protein
MRESSSYVLAAICSYESSEPAQYSEVCIYRSSIFICISIIVDLRIEGHESLMMHLTSLDLVFHGGRCEVIYGQRKHEELNDKFFWVDRVIGYVISQDYKYPTNH